MNLPPALAPWGPYLQDFPFDVGVALGPLAQRIAALLGPSGQDFDQPEGEVDGYDGLTRRGLPERMLLSDWMLAQEVPDEWARRAAEGELSYLQLARRAPQVSKVVAAIFDAGPDVLGTPRLGELAALLVLARRAREMGASLLWGIAQKPPAQLWRELSPSGAMALLEARGGLPVTVLDVEGWRDALGECDERWLVGGEGLAQLASQEESRLVFDDPFEEGRALDVMTHSHRGAVRHARLELPDNAVCTRLMRDPFGVKKESNAEVRHIKPIFVPHSNLVWLNGNSLAARSGSGGIVVFRVSSSPRGGVAKPRHYHFESRETLDFVGYHDGTVVGASWQKSGVQLFNLGGRVQDIPIGNYTAIRDWNNESELDRDEANLFLAQSHVLATTAPEDWEEKDVPPLRPLWNYSYHPYRPILLQPNGNLSQLVPGAVTDILVEESDVLVDEQLKDINQLFTGTIEVVKTHMDAVEGFDKGLIGVSGTAPALIVQFDVAANPTEVPHQDSRLFMGEGVQQAFWGSTHALVEEHNRWGVGAYLKREGWVMEWKQGGTTRLDRVEVAAGETVLGVVGWKTRWPSPALLVRGVDGYGLKLRGVNWNHPLVIGASVETAVVSPYTPYIAWIVERELTVYSLGLDVILGRWQWSEAP